MKKENNKSIKKSSTIFLQLVIILVGIIVLTLMLVMPHFEGRNTNATLFQIYFNDPFLAYVYLASVPFFIALFQGFTLLKHIRRNRVFSQPAVNNLKKIKYCAFVTAGAILAAIVYLKVASLGNNEDPAGAIMLGNIAIFASVVVGIASAIFEKTLQSAVDMKSENDLTV